MIAMTLGSREKQDEQSSCRFRRRRLDHQISQTGRQEPRNKQDGKEQFPGGERMKLLMLIMYAPLLSSRQINEAPRLPNGRCSPPSRLWRGSRYVAVPVGGEHYPRRTTPGPSPGIALNTFIHPTSTSVADLESAGVCLYALGSVYHRCLLSIVPCASSSCPSSPDLRRVTRLRENRPQVHVALRLLDDAQNSLNTSGIMSSDAAALPSPPDFAPWANGNRSRPPGGMYASGGQHSRPGSYHNGNSASPAGARPPRFPNIKDLQDQAASLDVTEATSVGSLFCVL